MLCRFALPRDRERRERGRRAGARPPARARPYHRDDPLRRRHALSEQAVQSHLPAGKGPAGAGLAELETIGGTMELLFREDPYLKSCEATVTASGPQGVRLDRTVFYPTGGGQPGDCGALVLPDGARLRVVDAVKGGKSEARSVGEGEVRKSRT